MLTGTALAGKVAKDIQAFMTQVLDSKVCTGAPARSSRSRPVQYIMTSDLHTSLSAHVCQDCQLCSFVCSEVLQAPVLVTKIRLNTSSGSDLLKQVRTLPIITASLPAYDCLLRMIAQQISVLLTSSSSKPPKPLPAVTTMTRSQRSKWLEASPAKLHYPLDQELVPSETRPS